MDLPFSSKSIRSPVRTVSEFYGYYERRKAFLRRQQSVEKLYIVEAFSYPREERKKGSLFYVATQMKGVLTRNECRILITRHGVTQYI